MITIKNSEELAKLVDENKDLHLENEDVHIEFHMSGREVRDVYCGNLFLIKNNQRFSFLGRNFYGGDLYCNSFRGEDFKGWDFNGRHFMGRDFIGGSFTGCNFVGRDFDGWNFRGWNFTGRNVFYWSFFNCTGKIKCESIRGAGEPLSEPVCLGGKLEIVKPKEVKSTTGRKIKIKVLDGQILEGEIIEEN